MQIPGSEPLRMNLVDDATIDEIPETGQFRPDIGVVTDSSPVPALILSAAGMDGAAGTVYTTKSGAVVKFSHLNDESRKSVLCSGGGCVSNPDGTTRVLSPRLLRLVCVSQRSRIGPFRRRAYSQHLVWAVAITAVSVGLLGDDF
jgi:hypothetical protein